MDSHNKRSRFVTYGITDWAAERKFFGRFYLSQGFREDKKFTNDCGPANLAIILNILLFQDNINAPPLKKDTVARASRFLFWDRIPQWVPRFGGATSPWGMVKAFNHWARTYNLNWRAVRKNKARKAHVLENLMMGKPVTALKIWQTNGAHWINLVRYSSEKERLYFLDPNPFLQYLPEDKRLQSQTWDEFNEDWSRSNWWTKLLGIQNELITYTKID
ncbi:MAG: hypothetical protein J7L66_03960 [Anaerolineaceae bacterium]|nr:hypothetical protein [Anaerolineaceae bacterium]